MGFAAFFLALALLVGVAAAVLVYVAYPHRDRRPRRVAWVADALGRAAGPVQVHDDVHTEALLADDDHDIAERFRRFERVMTAGIAGRPGT